jgi:hypothetical protein
MRIRQRLNKGRRITEVVARTSSPRGLRGKAKGRGPEAEQKLSPRSAFPFPRSELLLPTLPAPSAVKCLRLGANLEDDR